MKTNKINTILVSLATAVIFIVGVACRNSFFFGNPSDPTPTTTISAANRGSLRIYIEKNIKTRTIIVDAHAINFDQYSIEMTSDDGFAGRSADFATNVADFNNIEAGTWNIAVKAKRSGQVLATGARSGITIAANTTTDLTVDIKLIQSATGNVKVRISFPKISEIGYVGAKLLGEAADTPLAIIDNSPDVDHKMVAFERNNVASGVKDLLLTFRKGDASGTILGMYRETINIFDNLTSDKWIDNNGVLQAVLSYPATYFASTNSNLFDLTTDSGRAFTPPFNSSIYYYTLNVAHSQDTIKIIPTLSISGQSVKYRLNGAAGYSYPASGIQSDPLNLNGGDNTIDVEVTAQDRITKSYYKILVNRAPKPGVPVISGVENGYSYINDMTFSLSSADSASIRYTMTNDGSDPSDPTAASSLYSDPIDLTSGAGTKTIYKIKAVGFNSFGDASDVGGVWTVTIDKKPPTITDLDPTDDAENVDVSVDLVITFDEDVTIDQPDKEVIIYRRGSGLFDYEFERIPIDDPRVTWAGNRVTINPTKEFKSKLKYYVIIDNGAIRDIAGNSFAGIDHSSTWNFTIIDTGAPFIIDISSDPVSGSFKQGGVISIKVQFNETVWVLGFPTLSLNSGPTKATFSYGGGGTGSDTLTFTYTVGADDNTADLDVTSVNLPTGATIRDGASHNAILSIPAPPNRLRDNSDIVVDTTGPKIMGGATMSADNSYVTITFSEGVYTNAGASGGLVASDFSIVFNQNGGTATGATITDVSSDSGGALSGGESVVRVYFTITGSPSGQETITIKPASSTSIYDAVGNPANTSESTGALGLMISVVYNGNGADSGDVPVDPNGYTSGGTATVLDNTGSLAKTRDGISLRLDSWNTKADGTGTTYQPGATLAIGSTNVTLYAKWSALRCTGRAGGLIFYDKGNYDDGWRYLEAATTDLSNSAWANNGDITTGATETGFGTGKLNASKITSAFSGNYAAQRCANYTSGAYNDWFLPSKEELNAMYTELKQKGVGGFSDAIYWSSSERDAATSWGQDFSNGTVNGAGHSKLSAYRVRPVRSFGPDIAAPTLPSDKTITAIAAGSNPITLSWNYASDNSTNPTSLQYRVYYSTSNNISDVSACEANGTPAGYYTTNINTKTISVSLNTNYFFNVVVRDNSGNKAHYTAKSAKLYSVTYDENGATSGIPPAANYYIDGETVTVAENTGGLVKMQDGISLKFDGWKKGSGTTYQPGATFEMGAGNVTLTAQWSVLGGKGPAGGLVFFINNDPEDPHRDGWKYLEAAPQLKEWESKRWAPSDSGVGATATVVGAGKQNTIKIIAHHGAGDYAAKLCADLSHDGYNDWFLPSFYDLDAISGTLIADGDFSSGFYWSSSELDTYKAYPKKLSDSGGSGANKSNLYLVRAVRSFGPDAAPPTFPSGNITITGVGSTSVKLEWALATDGNGAGGSTKDANLQYRIYYSTSAANVSDVTACETYGTPFGYYNYYSAPASKTVTGLTGLTTGTTYWFNIVVRDNSGNKAHYTAKSAELYSVTYNGNGASGSPPVDANIYINGETVTVLGKETLIKMQDGISLKFVGWKSNATGTPTYQPGETFAMGAGNVILTAQWSVLGGTGPAGGVVFYDKGNYDDGWRYLEAAPISTEWTSKPWGEADRQVGGLTTITPGQNTIGVGKRNTIKIIDKYGNTTNDYAAKLCADLSNDGYNDWFLPSIKELDEVLNVRVEGGFSSGTGELYWSSNEYNQDNAYAKKLTAADGGNSTHKATTYFVRAVRSFGNDAAPPTFPSGSDITITGVGSTSVKLEWALATDGGSTLDANLQYRIYYSTSAADVSTVTACETNGTPFGYYNYYSAPAGKTVTGLTGISTGTTYWFNIVVRDNSGNKVHYTAKSAELFKVTYDRNNSDPGGTVPVDNNYYATGQTVTVAGNTGSLVKMQDGISLRLLWNTQSDGTGTSYKPADATFDMPSNNVTLYAKWTALGGVGPAGGFIFYDKGSYSDGWRYMEAAPSDQSSDIRWGAKTAVAGADGIGYGTGKQNTINIIAHYGDATDDYAAKLCDDLSYGGYNDWFLPSSYELGAMYTNLYKSGIGGFSAEPYWSSSEYSANAAVMRNFGESGSGGAPPPATSHSKTNTCRVRAARSF